MNDVLLHSMRYLPTCALVLTALVCRSQQSMVRPFAPELFPPEISGAVCGFANRGNIIYIAKEDTLAGKIFIFQATRKGKRWVNEQLLPFSGVYNDLGGRLTPDGKTFYFTSDRPGGSSRQPDNWNIWVTRLDDRDQWGDPQPVVEINEKGMECCPVPLTPSRILFSADRDKSTSWWIATWDDVAKTESFVKQLNQDGTWQWPSSLNRSHTILFLNSMKRKDSKGMDDLYVSFLEGSQWTPPINLGESVNSTQYEDGAILTPDEKGLIFCRHETASTPSQVLVADWKAILRSIRKGA